MESTNHTAYNYKKYIVNSEDFEIINKINSGGFGSVYSVQNKITKEKYAAKIITLDISDPKNRQMVNREILIMIRCQHPTIINFHGYSFRDFMNVNNMTIFMQLAENGSLENLLENSRKGLADHKYNNTIRQIILIGIARGMMHLHQHHVIHCDLKPGNVLIDSQFHPHLTDFGLSKIFEKTQTISQQFGTYPYMAPEVINENKYNGKIDVYSFGILMYEVITDSIPYPLFNKKKMTIMQFTNKVVHENFRPKFEVPVKKSIKKLIERCWSSDPKIRPTFEAIFNMLAYNLEDSIIDIYSTEENDKDDDEDEGEYDDEDDNKYYLDDVDVEEVISYADSIQSDENSIDVNNLLKKLQSIENTISPLRKENEEMKVKLNSIVENEINPLKKENLQLKNENKKMKTQIEKTSKTIDPIMKENQEMKEKLEEIENKINPLKKENEKIRMQLNNIVEDEIEPLKNENTQLKNENKKMKTQIEKAFKNIDPSMKEQFEEIIENRIKALKEENDKMKSQLSKIEKKMKEKHVSTDKDSSFEEKIDNDDTIVDIRKITIKEFNSLSLQSQQSCVLEILSKSEDSKQTEFFTSINAVLTHLLKFVQIKSAFYFELSCSDTIKFATIINCQVKILPKSIEVLFSNRSLHSPELAKILQQLNWFAIDLKYPSPYFDPIYNIISTLRKSLRFQINVFVTNTNEINSYFQDKSFISSVKVDVSVSTIKPNSFSGCSLLEEILIPPSVSSIGERSFYQCKSLKRIIIPCSITEIANGTFEECTSLADVEIPTSIIKIKSNSFHNCTSLTKIIIPPSVTSIENDSFNNCSSLKEITMSSSVKSIGNNCFYGIETIHITGDIQYIPDNMFYGCSTLKAIEIPPSIKTIGCNAFNGCKSLTKIVIPSSVTLIKDDAFNGCTSLTEILISPSVKTIGSNAFNGCTSITKIAIPSSVTLIKDGAFNECTSLTEILIQPSVKTIGNNAFNGCKSLTEISIPSSVKTIGENCFSKCTNLRKLILESTSSKYEINAFDGCSSLESLTYSSIKGKQAEESCQYPLFEYSNLNLTTFNRFDGETQIYYLSIINIIIENQIKKQNNNNNNSYIYKSDNNLRQKQSQIQNILNLLTYLSNELKPTKAHNLNYISISQKNIFIAPEITNILFCKNNIKCYSLNNMSDSLHIYLAIVYPSDNFSNIFNSIIPNKNDDSSNKYGKSSNKNGNSSNKYRICIFIKGIKSTGNRFRGNQYIHFVKFDSTIQQISGEEGQGSFENCTSLEQVIIPSSVTHIGSYAFNGCTSLTEISIPSSVKTIGKNCFSKCTNLRKLILESTSSKYEINAFDGCSSLESLTYSSIKEENSYWYNKYEIFKYSNLNSTTFNELDTETQFFYVSIINIINVNKSKKESYNQKQNKSTIQDILNLLTYLRNEYTLSLTHNSNYITILKEDFFINSEITDILFSKNYYGRNSFISHLSNTNNSLRIHLTIIYPSDNFKNIYNNIIQNKNGNSSNKYRICIFIKGIKSTDNRFRGNQYIHFVKFDSTIQQISGEEGQGSFENCTSLEQVIIPSSVTHIGSYAFNGCTSLTEISIPSSVKTIGKNCFSKCTNLRKLILESTSSKYEINAFDGCSSLESLTYSSIKEENSYWYNKHEIFKYSNLNSTTFNELDTETQFFYVSIINIINVNKSKKESYNQKQNKSTIQDILNLLTYLRDKLKQVKARFHNYITTSREDIFLDPIITAILFYQNKSFISIFNNISDSHPIYLTITYPSDNFENIYNNIIPNKNSNSSNKYRICIFIKGIKSTDNRFRGNQYIHFVKFDSTIQQISGEEGQGSFENCTSLEQVIIPSSVTHIGPYAFNGCSSLKNLTIPSTLKPKPNLIGIDSYRINYN